MEQTELERQLEAACRKVLKIESAVNFLCCAVINALCVWLLHKGKTAVPVDFWSTAVDTYITCHCVCVLTALFAGASAKRYRRAGLVLPERPGSFSAELPRRPWLLGAFLAGPASLALILLFGGAFALLGVPALPVWAFVLFKGLWGGALGTAVCRTALRRLLTE